MSTYHSRAAALAAIALLFAGRGPASAEQPVAAGNARASGAAPLAVATEKTFTAEEISIWRKKLADLAQLPEKTPNGWSKSLVDPARLLTVFPKLRMREGFVLRAYVFKDDANSNGFVWALPADGDFPAAEDCPRIESHFLKPPKPFDALDDSMEAVAGDDSPESYLQATLLRRALKEFGAGWHGVKWGMNRVLDADAWKKTANAEDDPMATQPTSEPSQWKWRAAQPHSWAPEVRMDSTKAVVTFFSYTALYEEGADGEIEKERIIHHTETYRRGKYRPLISEVKIAEGPNSIAF